MNNAGCIIPFFVHHYENVKLSSFCKGNCKKLTAKFFKEHVKTVDFSKNTVYNTNIESCFAFAFLQSVVERTELQLSIFLCYFLGYIQVNGLFSKVLLKQFYEKPLKKS